MSKIKAIDRTSIHRICSGQVILDLATAVKELVENSLDASASTIEVRLKDYGLDGLEVLDNGCGIQPEDYETLALKHYTSKIGEFEDLLTVRSFGFRGEALSSICGIGKLIVTTCTKDQEPVGVKLDYDSHGRLQSQTPIAREHGSTMSIKALFENLPVRYREFKKNIKREYAKCLDLMQAYALISDGVRISCSNQTGKGERVKQLATGGNRSMKDNFANVFGTKSLQSIMEISFTVDVDDTSGEVPEKKKIEISGLISRPLPNMGRSNTDRQYLYINKRPCELPKLAKVINEVYRTYNFQQYPIVVLNLSMPSGMYDVNVTPDKRTIFIHNERNIFESIKAELETAFTPARGFTIASVKNVGAFESSVAAPTDGTPEKPVKPPLTEHTQQSQEIATALPQKSIKEQPRVIEFTSLVNRPLSKELSPSENTLPPSPASSFQASWQALFATAQAKHTISENQSKKPATQTPHTNPAASKRTFSSPFPIIKNSQHMELNEQKPVDQRYISDIRQNIKAFASASLIRGNYKAKKALAKRKQSAAFEPPPPQESFAAGIGPDKAELAIEEFNRMIRKDDFRKMEILGQFNLGFIIVRLSNDLFIVDQHARDVYFCVKTILHTFPNTIISDEKYNYEMLTASLRITTQRLISPMPLNLTPQAEVTAMDHTDILKRNGFEVEYSGIEEPGRRLSLISVPQSSTIQFNRDDLEDLLHKIAEGAGEKVCCSRILTMLASKACRKSVMIGDPLDMSQMRSIVGHMSELNQPWV
ncbi:Mismatch repair endonuclease pms2 [Chytridiales sp. JEL 0842]|nr:Mismatch repair endonuclease pms2 [Chytridiales sp. JEL 0842]